MDQEVERRVAEKRGDNDYVPTSSDKRCWIIGRKATVMNNLYVTTRSGVRSENLAGV